MCAHYAIRTVMCATASDRGIDPDRVSLTRALRAARRSVRAGLGTRCSPVSSATRHDRRDVP